MNRHQTTYVLYYAPFCLFSRLFFSCQGMLPTALRCAKASLQARRVRKLCGVTLNSQVVLTHGLRTSPTNQSAQLQKD
jgi:hypothetical protein